MRDFAGIRDRCEDDELAQQSDCLRIQVLEAASIRLAQLDAFARGGLASRGGWWGSVEMSENAAHLQRSPVRIGQLPHLKPTG